MAENANTAEHELLKAIEGNKDSSLLKKPDFSSGIKMRFGFLTKPFFDKIYSGRIFDGITIYHANAALFWFIIVFSFWWIIILAGGITRLYSDTITYHSKARESPLSPLSIINTGLKEYAYYIDTILSRNVFNPLSNDTDSKETGDMPDNADNLRMVGISWSENTNDRYAMIEDILTKITYYVQEGDIILEFAVKEIGEKKIILTYKGKEIPLQ